jgi:cell wall-associated NlpC family hydrolase
MTSRAEYRIRRQGGEIFTSEPALRAEDLHAALDRMFPKHGPFRLKRPNEDFGPEKTEEEIVDILVNNVPDGAYGRPWIVAKDGVEERKLVIRKRAIAEGSRVLQVAFDQLGDDYNFGDAGPDRFDCSGLTAFCYNSVDYYLPHSAELQRTFPSVVNFGYRKLLKDGDLVFYDASSRLGHTGADHVGIVSVEDQLMVVDASSTYDMVVHRPIDSNNVIGFGRVPAVNGTL